ncbi:hypothetical protein LPC08_14160 [Roseomonas sp. OT10]|uniref:YhdP family protein n=1 Tax=Roseomonas cutis TaxID=2897332 RepID=UPI001E5B5FAF|nr:AsmA-like C-terminal region-containing protein [Roseomonas sp. OT10]UFN47172.1 hypothetical protein LPC08_14160 [Roseomonas sp. OT10]
MTAAAGQAGGRPTPGPAWRVVCGLWAVVHTLGRVAITLALLVVMALAALGWRLQQGPLSLPPLARTLEGLAERAGLPVEIGELTLAWAGWTDDRPLPIRVRLVEVAPAGLASGAPLPPEPAARQPGRAMAPDPAAPAPAPPRLSIPEAEVHFDLERLWHGQVVPQMVTLQRPSLVLELDRSGTPHLDLDSAQAGSSPPPDDAATAGDPMRDAFAVLLRPASPDNPLSALRELRITSGRLRILDHFKGVDVTLRQAQIGLIRAEDGVIRVGGNAVLSSGGTDYRATLSGTATPAAEGVAGAVELRLSLPAMSPAALAEAVPVLAPLSALQAPVALTSWLRHVPDEGVTESSTELRLGPGRLELPDGGQVELGQGPGGPAGEVGQLSLRWRQPGGGAPLRGRGEMRLGGGVVTLPGGREVAFRGAGAVVAAQEDAVSLESLTLDMEAPQGAVGPPPRLSVSGSARKDGQGWKGALELGLDRLAVPDIRLYWPVGVAEGGRSWITENLTAGTARNGRWHIEGALPADGSGFRLSAVNGTLQAEDVTVHWLRPIPPLERAQGTIRFLSADEIVIEAGGARQRGTALAVPTATVRLTELVKGPGLASITGRVSGPLADVFQLIRHPRLHLFEKRPLEVKVQGGQVEAGLAIRLPLLNDLPMEELDIRVQGHVARARLPDLVAGQGLERGELEVDVTAEGMRVAGTADLGPMPGARLSLDGDFRAGPPGQVVMRAQVDGPLDMAKVAALAPAAGVALSGRARLSIQAEQRRGGEARVALRGDLRGAGVGLGPVGWSKPADAAGTAEAVLRLQGERLAAIDRLEVEAPGLVLRSRAVFGAGSRPERLEITEARLGATQLTGELDFPARPTDPWRVAARGPVLDLRGILDSLDDLGGGEGDRGEATPFELESRFDRVLLKGGEVSGLRAEVSRDARGVIRRLRLTGRTERNPAFEALVTPRRGGRDLSARADDLGELLRLAGQPGTISGGRLAVTGAWRGEGPEAPLLGTVEMTGFSLHRVEVLGKLLQALSIYGILDALRGPGLHFSRLHVPFALTPEALGIEEAQAYSASLGITAQGRLLRRQERIEMEGTIVPSYAVNSALGRLPLVGRLFTAEEGGGLFSASFQVHGPLADPSVSVNPLTLLAPGALRGLLDGMARAAR